MSDSVITSAPLRSKAEDAAIACAKRATPPLNSNGCYQARDAVLFLEGVRWVIEEAKKNKFCPEDFKEEEAVVYFRDLEDLIK